MTTTARSAELDTLCVACGFTPLPAPPIPMVPLRVYEQVTGTHNIRCRVETQHGVVHIEAHTATSPTRRLWQLTLVPPIPLHVIKAVLTAATDTMSRPTLPGRPTPKSQARAVTVASEAVLDPPHGAVDPEPQ